MTQTKRFDRLSILIILDMLWYLTAWTSWMTNDYWDWRYIMLTLVNTEQKTGAALIFPMRVVAGTKYSPTDKQYYLYSAPNWGISKILCIFVITFVICLDIDYWCIWLYGRFIEIWRWVLLLSRIKLNWPFLFRLKAGYYKLRHLTVARSHTPGSIHYKNI